MKLLFHNHQAPDLMGWMLPLRRDRAKSALFRKIEAVQLKLNGLLFQWHPPKPWYPLGVEGSEQQASPAWGNRFKLDTQEAWPSKVSLIFFSKYIYIYIYVNKVQQLDDTSRYSNIWYQTYPPGLKTDFPTLANLKHANLILDPLAEISTRLYCFHW